MITENTFAQYLDEEERLLQRLTVNDCNYFGLHPSNVVPMHGQLPSDKARLLAELAAVRAHTSEKQLSSVPRRGGEGAILR